MEQPEMITTSLRATTNTATQTPEEVHTQTSVTEHATQEHSEHTWPHIPLIQWEKVWGPISNTSITTILFFFIVLSVSILANRALYSQKKSRLRSFFLTFIKFFDGHLRDSFQDKPFARRHFILVVGIFSIVFFGNLLWLVIDWLGSSISPTIFEYLRPMHSDLNTTAVLAAITVIMMLVVAVSHHWPVSTIKSYLFNFQWHGIVEKCVNVFVGWLHFIGLWATFASLSLRLFWNIFAGVVLLWVITYLWALATQWVMEIGRLLTIPFWFFEVWVALIQAVVFAGLMIAFFNSSKEEHH